MSGPIPQSLSSLVTAVESTQADTNVTTPVTPPAPKQSLQDVIDSVAESQASSSASAEKPVSGDDSKTQQGQVSSESQAQAKANLRELLILRGLEVPEELNTDELIVESLVNEFNTAATAFESPEYKAFLTWREQQIAAEKTGATASTAPVTQEQSVDPQEILNAIDQGAVTYNSEQKKWTAIHPDFNKYSDAMNSRGQKVNHAKLSLASDPEGFVAQKIKEAIAELKPATEVSELKELLQQIRQERTEHAEQAKITAWENANLAKLYVLGTGEMTAYGKAYQKIESEIDKVSPKISLAERHSQVLRQLAVIEEYLPVTKPVVQQPAPVVPRQSFLQSAERRNGNANRLSDYQGAASNSVAPQIPKGKQGFPSLNGIIEQNNSLTSH